MRSPLVLAALCLVLSNCEVMPRADDDGGSEGGGGGSAGSTGGGGGGGAIDAGEPDAGGVDAGGVDAGGVDAGEVDAGEVDAGEVDAGAPDAGNAGLDAGPIDAGAADAGFTCVGRSGAACTTDMAAPGLCRNEVCASCAGPQDDVACTQGWSADAGTWLCEAGACVRAECRSDADCASAGKTGQLCGLSSLNQCGTCTTDDQCKASSFGAASICNPSLGVCVPGACSTPNTACSANPGDFCCNAACVPGDCCTSAQCASGSICVSNTCTVCGPVANDVFFVDPVNGQDTGTNGSSGCPFQTLSRGLQVIVATYPSGAPAGTRLVLRAPSNSGTGERFPLRVPPQVMVESEDAGAPQTVTVSAGNTGFVLSAPDSGVRFLVIDGASAGATGVRVETGATLTTTVEDLSVRGFTSAGVQVTGGSVRIGQGVVLTQNGSTSSGGAGLRVSGGVASVAVAAGQRPTRFDDNRANGVLVESTGRLLLQGVPDLTGFPAAQNPPAVTGDVGTVTANGNTLANVAFASTSTTVSSIDGVVANRGQGNGLNILAGSNVVVRNCVAVGNRNAGLRVSPSSTNPVTGIDLGSAVDPGRNVLQSSVRPNTDSGLCVGNFFNFNMTIPARGNDFGGGRSCRVATTPMTTLQTSRAGCTGMLDVGIEPTTSGASQTNVHVTLDACQNL